jgi:hypothetical protein
MSETSPVFSMPKDDDYDNDAFDENQQESDELDGKAVQEEYSDDLD